VTSFASGISYGKFARGAGWWSSWRVPGGLASLVPILWETGVGSDVMKPIAAPIVGGMITSTINVLILVPVFFVMMKARALRQGTLHGPGEAEV
jgi:hypothetical protein